MFEKKSSRHSEEEYDRIVQVIKSQLLSNQQQTTEHTFVKDEFSTKLVSERIEALEHDKALLSEQVKLFQRFIAEIHPQLDEIITELARLKSMTI